MYWRFSRWQRSLHAALFTGFVVAALTGLPLRFSAQPWAATLCTLLGGVATLRWLHRGAALLLGGCAVAHVATLLYLLGRRPGLPRGPDSLLPQRRDGHDLWQHLRWLLGQAPPPAFERWTYWQKFDYWAAMLGLVGMGSSGLVVWLAPLVTRWLPGWAVTVSLRLHGHEAVLALGVISVFHFFHAHLRPGKFPADLAMFTGRVEEAALRREHARYYARLQQSGRLAPLRAAPPPRWLVRLGRWLGWLPVALCWLLWLLVLWSLMAGAE
ncbi:MAG: hypothetical protein KatS3mg131_1833 [Candidatus Tectimicrobiota bacterium]|nr:MAG: hypothetical protein KatS3mg131_1833 [Candidatus Tectomicrobia bacterium]